MRKAFFALFALLAISASAETDVTSTYLTNADWTSGVSTASVTSTGANVDGWDVTYPSTDGWHYAATFNVGSGLALNSHSVPSTNADGEASGSVLGVTGGWGNSVSISQTVTLPAGSYRMHTTIYNPGTTVYLTNLAITLSSADGQTETSPVRWFPASAWAETDLNISIAQSQEVTLTFAFTASSGSSSNSPAFFMGPVTLYKQDATDTWIPTEETVDFTQLSGTGTYSNLSSIAESVPEHYSDSHATGDKLTSTTSNLENGVYELGVYAFAHQAWLSQVAADGLQYSYLTANDQTVKLPVINNTGVADGEPILYKLSNVHVTDGTLKVVTGNTSEGANWHTGYISYVKKCARLQAYGDVNNDATYSILDQALLIDALKSNSTSDNIRLDVNVDEAVSETDVEVLRNILLGLTPGNVVEGSSASATVESVQASGEYSQQLSDYTTRLNITTSLSNISRISVLALGGETLNGTVSTLTVSDGADPIVSSSAASDSHSYRSSTASDVIAITSSDVLSAGTYTAYLRPVTLSSGVMVTISTSDGSHYSQTFTDITAGAENELAFDQSTAQNLWMATLPSTLNYNMVSTPCAHDAATSGVSGLLSSYAKCQDMTIAQLLAAGVRGFDLRPTYTSDDASDIELDKLTIYHSSYSTGVLFKDAIATLVDFVKTNPTENISIIMSKENSSSLISLTDQSETWRASIRECFGNYSDYLLAGLGPTDLSGCRGKVTVVSRNPYGNSSNSYLDVVYGAIASDWPDDDQNTAFGLALTRSWNWYNATYGVQDCYNASLSNKQSYAKSQAEAFGAITTRDKYNYNYLSVAYSSSNLNSPETSAKTVNPAMQEYFEGVSYPLGYIYADFIGSSSTASGAALLQTIVEQNWKYAF